MIVGPFRMKEKNHFTSFSELDLLSLQGATIGSFGLGLGFMCNGANFALYQIIFQGIEWLCWKQQNG
jgi:hypothetical protein